MNPRGAVPQHALQACALNRSAIPPSTRNIEASRRPGNGSPPAQDGCGTGIGRCARWTAASGAGGRPSRYHGQSGATATRKPPRQSIDASPGPRRHGHAPRLQPSKSRTRRAHPAAHAMYWPPFAESVEPVMKPASSLARNTTQRATSSGSPRRPAGISGRIFDFSTSSGTARTISVPM